MLSSEAIGSIPRTAKLQAAMQSGEADVVSAAQAEALEETINTLKNISAFNSISDGEQVFFSLTGWSFTALIALFTFRQSQVLSLTQFLD